MATAKAKSFPCEDMLLFSRQLAADRKSDEMLVHTLNQRVHASSPAAQNTAECERLYKAVRFPAWAGRAVVVAAK